MYYNSPFHLNAHFTSRTIVYQQIKYYLTVYYENANSKRMDCRFYSKIRISIYLHVNNIFCLCKQAIVFPEKVFDRCLFFKKEYFYHFIINDLKLWPQNWSRIDFGHTFYFFNVDFVFGTRLIAFRPFPCSIGCCFFSFPFLTC